MKTLICASIFLMSLQLAGQTITVVDDTPNSPAPIHGSATFNSTDSFPCSVMGHNNNSKPIVAVSVQLEYTKPNGQTVSLRIDHDHYFKTLDVAPGGADFEIESFCDSPHESIERLPTVPRFHARTVFVQYADESAWGSPAVANELITRRKDSLVFYQSLQSIVASFGLDGLGQVLAQADKPGSSAWENKRWLKALQASSGLQAVSDKINALVAISNSRLAAQK